uniref:Uncharacterized protein n=1 Tax=Candidatus Kentrum sp. SD TaxID=2126332 RepID=A0A451BL84_9GAMM|nr:MAG: hypothetical protein BECKSD772D_GA0070982_10345 [Candidatus Kentron sp. SD]
MRWKPLPCCLERRYLKKKTRGIRVRENHLKSHEGKKKVGLRELRSRDPTLFVNRRVSPPIR